MGVLFGKIDVDDKDLHAVGVMVEETTSSMDRLSATGTAIAKAIEKVADVVGKKKISALWGLVKME